MRLLSVLTVIFSVSCLSATANETSGDASAGAERAKTCSGCHNSPISLKGRGADVIAEQINAILARDKGHPTELADLSEKDVADVAAFLDGA